jgi:hypothetical protein
MNTYRVVEVELLHALPRLHDGEDRSASRLGQSDPSERVPDIR